MSTIRTIYEIVTRGGTESEQQLRQVGKAGAEAFAKIDAAAAVVPKSLRAVDAAASSVRGSIDSLAAKAGPLGAAFQAIGGPLGLLAAAGAAAGLGLASLAKGAAESAGKLVDLSDLTGVSTQTLQAYSIAAAGAGVSQQAFASAIQTFTTNVGQDELGTGRLAGKLKLLDPAFLGVVNSAATVEEKFDLVVAKLNELPPGAERAALAVAAFGQEGAKIANVGETVADVTEKFAGLSAVIGDDLLRAADTASDALDEQTAILRQQILALQTEAAPAILGFEAAWVSGAARIVVSLREVLQTIGLIDQSVNDEFADLSKRRNELAVNLKTVETNPGVRVQPAQQEAAAAALRKEIDLIDEKMRALRAVQRTDKEAAEQEAANLKRAHTLKQGELAEIRAQQALQTKLDAAAKAGASAAASAAKAAQAAHTRGLEEVIKLEQQAHVAGLDGIAAIEAARDVEYEKFAALVEESNLTQEEAARGYVAIWEAADKEITETRQKEADKQAEVVRKASEKAAKEAEKAAEQIERQQLQLAETVGDALGDALVAFVDDGKVNFDELWRGFLDTGLRAIAQLAAQELVIGVSANATGGNVTGLATQLLGGGGNSIWGQLLGVGKDLVGGVFNLTAATDAAATAFDVPISGIAGSTTTGAGGAGGLGAGLAGAGIAAAWAAAAIGIIGTITTAIAASKARTSFFDRGDSHKFVESAIYDQAILGIIAEITTRISSLGAVGGKQGGKAMFDLLNGDVNAKNLAYSTALFAANPLAPILYLASQPPTKGTALRKSFEEFIEQDEFGFFGRDSGTFIRGVGQTGRLGDSRGDRTPVRVSGIIGEGARGIARDEGLDFPDALRVFIERQKEAIGLTDKQLQQFTALGVAFRAQVGGKAGNEESRSLSIIADLLGSITVEGASAAESMEIVQKAVASLGRPDRVFETLNEFFTSSENDVAVEDYRAAVQGLASALFVDLPQGVDAASIALDQLNADGAVTFKKLEEQITAAVAEANALGPALAQAFQAGITDAANFDAGVFGDSLFAAVETQLRDAIATAVFDGFIQGAFKGEILGPFLAALEETIGKVKGGELTQAEGNAILAQAAADARDNLELLRPLIDQAVAAGQDLATVFDAATDAANDTAEAVKRLAKQSFDQSIDRGILGLLSPNLAAQFDLEVQQRERLAAAREVGADLVDVERLNGLERAALLEAQAKDTQSQITRIYEQARAAAERAIAGVKALVTQLTATTASPLPPEEALANAQREFAALAGRARGGDLGAIEAVPAAGQAVIDLARELFGSTDRFFALFNPTLATLQDIAGLNPSAVKISAGDQAIVDAIQAESAEALALYQQMIDALLLSAEGKPVAQGGAAPGDQISVGVPGPTTGGQFGLGSVEQRRMQATIAGLAPGGATEQAVRGLLSGTPTWADVLAAGEGSGLTADLVDAILQSFTGVRSVQGFHKVLGAVLGKIQHPDVLSPVLGFEHGGSFRVRDSIPLMPGVRVSPGETVTVTTNGMESKLSVMVQQQAETVAELRALRREYAVVSAELQQIRVVYQHQSHRPAVPL